MFSLFEGPFCPGQEILTTYGKAERILLVGLTQCLSPTPSNIGGASAAPARIDRRPC